MDDRGIGKRHGFSIIELIIVLVVLAVMVAFALPNGIRFLQLHRLDSGVSVISNKVMEARMDAIKRNRTSMVRLDLAARRAQVRSTDNAAMTNWINVGLPGIFPQDVVLDAVGNVDISFDSMGRLPAGAQTVTILENGSGRRKNILISPAGNVTVGQMF